MNKAILVLVFIFSTYKSLYSQNPYNIFDDEFENSCSLVKWKHLAETEGWNANHLESFGINETGNGQMVLMPYSTTWYANYVGPLIYQTIANDFIVTTKIHVTNHAQNGMPSSIYSLGGLMLRSPQTLTNGAVGWLSNQENYVFLSCGFASTNHPSCNNCPGPHFEVKSTTNGNSVLNVSSISSLDVIIRVVRIRPYVVVLSSFDNGNSYNIVQRYNRNDMPDTLQVGMVSYTDYNKVATYDPLFHNDNNLYQGINPDPSSNFNIQFNPDIISRFDFIRFLVGQTPPNLVGLNWLNTNQVTDQMLLDAFSMASPATNGYNDDIKIWNGSFNRDWLEPQNWQNNEVPSNLDQVKIPNCNCIFKPLISTMVTIKSLNLDFSGDLEIATSGYLDVAE